MYQLIHLDGSNSARYEALTFQHLAPLLQRIDGDPTILAIGAEELSLIPTSSDERRPIGLVVARWIPNTKKAEVVSFFVNPTFRRIGVATSLLNLLESELRALGCRENRFVYYSGKSITPILEAFLQKNEWSVPVLEAKVYRADIRIAEAPWLRKTRLPHPLRCLLWSDCPESAKINLKQSAGERYPHFLSPFKEDFRRESSNSIVLMNEAEIVGWCITGRLAQDTVLYDSVFVNEEYRNSGCAFIMLAQSINLQLEQNIPYAMFTVNQITPYMIRIVDRWLTPYTNRISEKRAALKPL